MQFSGTIGQIIGGTPNFWVRAQIQHLPTRLRNLDPLLRCHFFRLFTLVPSPSWGRDSFASTTTCLNVFLAYRLCNIFWNLLYNILKIHTRTRCAAHLVALLYMEARVESMYGQFVLQIDHICLSCYVSHTFKMLLLQMLHLRCLYAGKIL